jgi:hypothetical protein
MSHDSIGLDPGGLIPHEKREETGHPDRNKVEVYNKAGKLVRVEMRPYKWDDLCPCGCGQTLKQDFDRRYDPDRVRVPLTCEQEVLREAMGKRLLGELMGMDLNRILMRQQQDEGRGEPEIKE